MAELKALPTAVLIHIAKLLNVPLKGMDAVIELLDGGATVPFIARYRKEVTGGKNHWETVLKTISLACSS